MYRQLRRNDLERGRFPSRKVSPKGVTIYTYTDSILYWSLFNPRPPPILVDRGTDPESFSPISNDQNSISPLDQSLASQQL